MENTAFIALGSNIGDRYNYLMEAIRKLNKDSGIRVVNCSSIYETVPVGYEDQELFLNMVIEITTGYQAQQLLDICLKIELELGRKRKIRWGPRTIDLDILTFNQENIKTEQLIVPHPRMLERAFVMVPLLELYRSNPIPALKELFKSSGNGLPDKEGVRLWKQRNGEDVSAPFGN